MERGAVEEEGLDLLLDRLSAQARVLPLHSGDIEVLESPDQFFQELLHGLSTAQRLVTVASLYLGTEGGRERQFLDALAAAAHDTAGRPDLRLHVLLDALRSTRPTRGDAAAAATPAAVAGPEGSSGSSSSSRGADGATMTSTAEVLAVRLLEGQQAEMPGAASASADPRVAVSLFHTPALRGLLKRVLPPRVSEVVGVQHMKTYIFDDTVIISGANISSNYLSNRQDRYLVLRRAPQLAAFLRTAVSIVGRFSYQLHPVLPDGADAVALPDSASAASAGGGSNSGGSGARPRRRDVLLQLLQEQRLPWQRIALQHHHLKRHRLQRQQRYRLGPCPAGVDPVRHAASFCRLLRGELLPLFVGPEQQRWAPVLDFAVLAAESADAEEEAGMAPTGGASSRSSSRGEDASSHAAPAAAEQQPLAAPPAPASAGHVDTWIVPLVQAGFAGIRQEERCTLAALAWAASQQQEGSSSGVSSTWASGRSWWTGGSSGSSSGSGSSGSNGGSSSSGSRAVRLQLASPYLNLAHPYERFLSRQAGGAQLELITAAPEANGFFGSKGMSGRIPLAYSLLEQRTWRHLTRPPPAWRQVRWDRRSSAAGQAADGGGAAVRRLWEYCRPGHEFHAKGIWLSFPPPEGASHATASIASGSFLSGQLQQQPQQQELPPPAVPAVPVTALGSSNFGFRSLHRDLEVQFLLITRSKPLQQALGREVEALKSHCQAVLDSEAHFRAPGRHGGAMARLAVRLLRGFL